jgi:hypothetical protein
MVVFGGLVLLVVEWSNNWNIDGGEPAPVKTNDVGGGGDGSELSPEPQVGPDGCAMLPPTARRPRTLTIDRDALAAASQAAGRKLGSLAIMGIAHNVPLSLSLSVCVPSRSSQ